MSDIYQRARAYYRCLVWEPGMPAWENATQAQRDECYAVVALLG